MLTYDGSPQRSARQRPRTPGPGTTARITRLERIRHAPCPQPYRRRHGRPAAAPALVSVVDAHVHLWDLAARPQPWTGQFPVLLRDFLLSELEKVMDDHGVDAAVVVQAGDTVGETLDLLALAGPTPRLAGVVGWVDLDGPDVGGAVAALRAAPGGRKLVAVRHQLQVEPEI